MRSLINSALGVLLVTALSWQSVRTCFGQGVGTDLPRPSDGHGNGGGVRAKASNGPTLAPLQLRGPSRPDSEEVPTTQPVDLQGTGRDGDDEEMSAVPPESIAGAFRLRGEIRGEELQAALQRLLVGATRGGETPPELYDPAYDQYVNMSNVGVAWQSQDAAALADGALQLLEGERILMRPHAKLPAEKVLILAGKIAVEKKDTETLERLRKAAERHGKKEVAAQLSATNKLAAAARDEEEFFVSIEDTSPEEYGAFHDYAERIRGARIAGEAITLENLQDEIERSELLMKQRRDYLLRQIQKTSAVLPKDGQPDEAIAALSRLGGASRGWGIDDVNKYVERRTDSFNSAVSAERRRAERTVSGFDPYKQPNSYENRRSSGGSNGGGSNTSSSASLQIGANGQVYAGNQYVGRASLQRLASGHQIWIYRTPGGRTISRLY